MSAKQLGLKLVAEQRAKRSDPFVDALAAASVQARVDDARWGPTRCAYCGAVEPCDCPQEGSEDPKPMAVVRRGVMASLARGEEGEA
jgi:hypothetical protein